MLELKNFHLTGIENDMWFYEGVADHYFIYHVGKNSFFTVRHEWLNDENDDGDVERNYYDFCTLSECIAFIEEKEKEA